MREFVLVCRKIALVYLRRKVTSRRLHPEFFSLTLEDLALDCIADLFQRDESGSMFQVKAYFEGITHQRASEEELLSHLRRLTFSKVNQRLFRLYNEADPAVGKILRNMKLAIQSLRNFVVSERFGEQCIAPAMTDTLEHLPAMERGEIRQRLVETARAVENIPTILAHFSRYLRDQTEHSRIVPIMDLAFAIRTLYGTESEQEHGDPEDNLIKEDARRIILDACEHVEKGMKAQYVGKKRILEEMFEKYFLVIGEHLESIFVGNDGELFAYFERLRSYARDLSREEYSRLHKSKIEYLGRLAHEEALERLRANFK